MKLKSVDQIKDLSEDKQKLYDQFMGYSQEEFLKNLEEICSNKLLDTDQKEGDQILILNLLDRIDELLELFKYKFVNNSKQFLNEKQIQKADSKEKLKILNENLYHVFKCINILLKNPQILEVFKSLEHVILIINYTDDMSVIRQGFQICSMYVSYIELIKDTSYFKKEYPYLLNTIYNAINMLPDFGDVINKKQLGQQNILRKKEKGKQNNNEEQLQIIDFYFDDEQYDKYVATTQKKQRKKTSFDMRKQSGNELEIEIENQKDSVKQKLMQKLNQFRICENINDYQFQPIQLLKIYFEEIQDIKINKDQKLNLEIDNFMEKYGYQDKFLNCEDIAQDIINERKDYQQLILEKQKKYQEMNKNNERVNQIFSQMDDQQRIRNTYLYQKIVWKIKVQKALFDQKQKQELCLIYMHAHHLIIYFQEFNKNYYNFYALSQFLEKSKSLTDLHQDLLDLFNLKMSPYIHSDILYNINMVNQFNFNKGIPYDMNQNFDILLNILKDFSGLKVVQKEQNQNTQENKIQEEKCKVENIEEFEVQAEKSHFLPLQTLLSNQFQKTVSLDVLDQQQLSSEIPEKIIICVEYLINIWNSEFYKDTFLPWDFEVILSSGRFLAELVKQESMNRDFQLIEKITNKIQLSFQQNLDLLQNKDRHFYYYWKDEKWEKVTQNQMDEYCQEMLYIINQIIQGDKRRLQRQNATTICRKISESGFYKILDTYFSFYEEKADEVNDSILYECMLLLQNIIGELVNQIDILVESGIIEKILKIISNKKLSQDLKNLIAIVNFVHQCSLKEGGKVICNKYKIIDKVFTVFYDLDFAEAFFYQCNDIKERKGYYLANAILSYYKNIETQRSNILDLIGLVFKNIIQIETAYVEKGQAVFEGKEDKHPEKEYKIQDCIQISRLVQNFSRIYRYLTSKYKEANSLKQILDKFIGQYLQMINFPIWGLFDYDETKQISKCLRTLSKYEQTNNGKMFNESLQMVEESFDKIEIFLGKKLFDLNNFSEIYSYEEINYTMNKEELTNMLKKNNKEVYNSIKIICQLKFSETLLDILRETFQIKLNIQRNPMALQHQISEEKIKKIKKIMTYSQHLYIMIMNQVDLEHRRKSAKLQLQLQEKKEEQKKKSSQMVDESKEKANEAEKEKLDVEIKQQEETILKEFKEYVENKSVPQIAMHKVLSDFFSAMYFYPIINIFYQKKQAPNREFNGQKKQQHYVNEYLTLIQNIAENLEKNIEQSQGKSEDFLKSAENIDTFQNVGGILEDNQFIDNLGLIQYGIYHLVDLISIIRNSEYKQNQQFLSCNMLIKLYQNGFFKILYKLLQFILQLKPVETKLGENLSLKFKKYNEVLSKLEKFTSLLIYELCLNPLDTNQKVELELKGDLQLDDTNVKEISQGIIYDQLFNLNRIIGEVQQDVNLSQKQEFLELVVEKLQSLYHTNFDEIIINEDQMMQKQNSEMMEKYRKEIKYNLIGMGYDEVMVENVLDIIQPKDINTGIDQAISYINTHMNDRSLRQPKKKKDKKEEVSQNEDIKKDQQNEEKQEKSMPNLPKCMGSEFKENMKKLANKTFQLMIKDLIKSDKFQRTIMLILNNKWDFSMKEQEEKLQKELKEKLKEEKKQKEEQKKMEQEKQKGEQNQLNKEQKEKQNEEDEIIQDKKQEKKKQQEKLIKESQERENELKKEKERIFEIKDQIAQNQMQIFCEQGYLAFKALKKIIYKIYQKKISFKNGMKNKKNIRENLAKLSQDEKIDIFQIPEHLTHFEALNYMNYILQVIQQLINNSNLELLVPGGKEIMTGNLVNYMKSNLGHEFLKLANQISHSLEMFLSSHSQSENTENKENQENKEKLEKEKQEKIKENQKIANELSHVFHNLLVLNDEIQKQLEIQEQQQKLREFKQQHSHESEKEDKLIQQLMEGKKNISGKKSRNQELFPVHSEIQQQKSQDSYNKAYKIKSGQSASKRRSESVQHQQQQKQEECDNNIEVINFCLNLIEKSNQIENKYEVQILKNNIVQGLLIQLIRITKQDEKYVIYLNHKQGIQSIQKIKSLDKLSGILDLFYQLLENCILSDKNIQNCQYEMEIKYFFYQLAIEELDNEKHNQQSQSQEDQQQQEKEQDPNNKNDQLQKQKSQKLMKKKSQKKSQLTKIQSQNTSIQQLKETQYQPNQSISYQWSLVQQKASQLQITFQQFVTKFKSKLEQLEFANIFNQICEIQKPAKQSKNKKDKNSSQLQEETSKKSDNKKESKLKENEQENQENKNQNENKESQKEKVSLAQQFKSIPNYNNIQIKLKPEQELHKLQSVQYKQLSKHQELQLQGKQSLKKVNKQSSQQHTDNQQQQLQQQQNQDQSLEEKKQLKEDHQINFKMQTAQYKILQNFMESFVSQYCECVLSQNDKEKDKSYLISLQIMAKSIHLLIRKNPLLLPMVAKFKCNRILKSYFKDKPEEQKILQVFGETKGVYNNCNFITFLIKFVYFFSPLHFHHLIFEFCLNSTLLFENGKKMIYNYSLEIKKKILQEIYQNLEKELCYQTPFENLFSIQRIVCYSTLHTFLLSLTDIAKLSLKIDENYISLQGCFNFLKLYTELFKKFKLLDLQKHQDYTSHILSPLTILHQYSVHLIVSNKFQKKNEKQKKNDQSKLTKDIEQINAQLMPQNSLSQNKFSKQWEDIVQGPIGKNIQDFGMLQDSWDIQDQEENNFQDFDNEMVFSMPSYSISAHSSNSDIDFSDSDSGLDSQEAEEIIIRQGEEDQLVGVHDDDEDDENNDDEQDQEIFDDEDLDDLQEDGYIDEEDDMDDEDMDDDGYFDYDQGIEVNIEQVPEIMNEDQEIYSDGEVSDEYFSSDSSDIMPISEEDLDEEGEEIENFSDSQEGFEMQNEYDMGSRVYKNKKSLFEAKKRDLQLDINSKQIINLEKVEFCKELTQIFKELSENIQLSIYMNIEEYEDQFHIKLLQYVNQKLSQQDGINMFSPPSESWKKSSVQDKVMGSINARRNLGQPGFNNRNPEESMFDYPIPHFLQQQRWNNRRFTNPQAMNMRRNIDYSMDFQDLLRTVFRPDEEAAVRRQDRWENLHQQFRHHHLEREGGGPQVMRFGINRLGQIQPNEGFGMNRQFQNNQRLREIRGIFQPQQINIELNPNDENAGEDIENFLQNMQQLNQIGGQFDIFNRILGQNQPLQMGDEEGDDDEEDDEDQNDLFEEDNGQDQIDQEQDLNSDEQDDEQQEIEDAEAEVEEEELEGEINLNINPDQVQHHEEQVQDEQNVEGQQDQQIQQLNQENINDFDNLQIQSSSTQNNNNNTNSQNSQQEAHHEENQIQQPQNQNNQPSQMEEEKNNQEQQEEAKSNQDSSTQQNNQQQTQQKQEETQIQNQNQSENQQQQQQPQQQQQMMEEEQQPQQQQEQEQQQQEQQQEQQNQGQGNQQEQQDDFMGRSLQILSSFGLEGYFFDRYQIDPLVFDQMPEEFKFEIIMQYLPQEQQRQETVRRQREERERVERERQQQQQQQQQQEQQQQGQQQQAQQNQQGLNILDFQQILNNLNGGNNNNQQQQQQGENQPQQQAQQEQNQQQQQQQNEQNQQQNSQNNDNNQNQQQNQQNDNQEQGQDQIDQEFLNSLPEELRLEVQLQMQQQRGDNQQTQQQQTLEFINSLPLDTREEVLREMVPSQLETLPQEIQEEARRYQNSYARNMQYQYQQPQHENLQELENQNIKKQQQLKQEREQQLLKKQKEAQEIFHKDKNLQNKLPQVDEKLIEQIYKLLYISQDNFIHFPFSLLKSMLTHPQGEFKILDGLMYLLKNSNMKELKELLIPKMEKLKQIQSENQNKMKEENLENEEENTEKVQQDQIQEQFPVTRQINENLTFIDDYNEVYKSITLKILYILSKLTFSNPNFFIDQPVVPESNKKKHQNKKPLYAIQMIQGDEKYKQKLQVQNSKENQQISDFPYLELIQLLNKDQILESSIHMKYLVQTIYNITKRFQNNIQLPQEQNEDSNDMTKEQLQIQKQIQNKFKLQKAPIMSICHALQNDSLEKSSMTQMSDIINILCFDKWNLDGFINELRDIVLHFSHNINDILIEGMEKYQNAGQMTQNKQKEQFEITKELQELIEGHDKLQQIFLIIRQLFKKSLLNISQEKEKELNQDKQKEKEQDKKMEEEKDKSVQKTQYLDKEKEKHDIQEQTLENVKTEIRIKFQELMNENLLKQMWLNVSQILQLLEDINVNQIHTLINKLSAVLDCFFIIYQIMADDDILVKQNKKQKKSIAQLEDVGLYEEEKKVYSQEDVIKMSQEQSDPTPMFKFICQRSQKILNHIIKKKLREKHKMQKQMQRIKNQGESILDQPIGVILRKFPEIVNFENKKAYFNAELDLIKKKQKAPSNQLRIRRDRMFEDTFNQFQRLGSAGLKGKITIQFDKEEGIDAGGVTKEWYQELSKQIFNANYALFKKSSTGNTYQPNPHSNVNQSHLEYFKFIGRLIGKALYDGQLLDAYFTRSFYKHILGQPINYKDIEDQDNEFYQNMKRVVENDITGWDLYFSFDYEEYGVTKKKDLCEHGSEREVTEENKLEYVQLYCYEKMAKSIEKQIVNFLEGFHELIPKEIIQVFDSNEMELMISGLPDIDIQDLKQNTTYNNYSQESKVIQWFWEVMEEMDLNHKALFLQFVTGTSKVPLGGFKELIGMNGHQLFSIHKAYGKDALPQSHTCFNQLDLPDYDSKEKLKDKLYKSITYGNKYFGKG